MDCPELPQIKLESVIFLLVCFRRQNSVICPRSSKYFESLHTRLYDLTKIIIEFYYYIIRYSMIRLALLPKKTANGAVVVANQINVRNDPLFSPLPLSLSPPKDTTTLVGWFLHYNKCVFG